MHTLYEAKARRAGAHITITAKDVQGKPVRVVGIAYIDFTSNPPVAVDQADKKFALAIPADF